MSYAEFFLAGPSAAAELDLIEITHPEFSQAYYIVRNAVGGVTVTLEDGTTQRAYLYYPLGVKPMGFRDNLDQGFQITVGDTGDTLPEELNRVYNADAMDVYPTFVYRAYRSDDLTVPLYGPVTLRIEKVTQTEEGASFDAIAPSVNNGRTGEVYRLDRFPMLRGLL